MSDSDKKDGSGLDLNPEIDRRRFLAVSGTLAAGVAIAGVIKPATAAPKPAPKLAADPTQFDDGVQIVMSVCQNCHGRCGIMARVKDGILLKLDGNPYHPNNFDADERPAYSTSLNEAKKKPARLCAKGQAGVQVVYDPYRIKQPLKRVGQRGAGKWKAISWDEAFTRIAKLMKDDRDKNFETKNADGATVNRWLSTGMLAASASSNESGYLTHKVVRSLGMLAFDNQARV